ncbi:MAG: hypothetical protein ACODAA_01835 [Gemmatimonadota bacterium]
MSADHIPPPLERAEFEAESLIRQHPPQWHHPNKQVVYEVATSTGDPFAGRIRYARWAEMELPERPPPHRAEPEPASWNRSARVRFDIRPGHYDYALDPCGRSEWHVNFADPHLFGMYEWALFAQDEIQVAEHPILGSVRDALTEAGKATGPRTVDRDRRPTPVTVTGAQRRVAIDTRGIYGNAFAASPESTVRAACTPLSPLTVSNIVAMAAPAVGHGVYSRAEIDYVVGCAYTGFRAARAESEALAAAESGAEDDARGRADPGVLVHTGFWGCGAFGGNRSLMPMLQAFAAELAGVDVAFHAFDEAGIATVEGAFAAYRELCAATPGTGARLDAIEAQGFEWGVSDGN